NTFPPDNTYMFISNSLMPYYANMILAGHENKAREWIRKNGKGEILEWLDDKKDIQSIHNALVLKRVGEKMKKRKEYVY
ncbi:MAG: hypothetical protein KAZ87_12110, partial [Spirochaetes bacterium]|nr:hypothetical protein [Spirochaetota bacterium]